MPSEQDLQRLYHIWDAATQAQLYLGTRNREALEADAMLQDALVRRLEVIGEAAAGVSIPCREIYAFLPWRVMIGMRNRLIHAYFDVNLTTVWLTVTEDLPGLIASIEPILRKEGLL
jgi:uncharacterized protein with HEPN domain